MRNIKSKQFYLLWMEQDLLEQWGVCKISGHVGGKGRKILQICDSKLAASQLLSDLEYTIRQRGFIYDDLESDDYFSLRPQTLNEVLKD